MAECLKTISTNTGMLRPNGTIITKSLYEIMEDVKEEPVDNEKLAQETIDRIKRKLVGDNA